MNFFFDFSLPLLGLAFVAGAVGNTAVVIFFGFVSYYREIFTSALSAGFGLSGLLPSLLVRTEPVNPGTPILTRFPASDLCSEHWRGSCTLQIHDSSLNN